LTLNQNVTGTGGVNLTTHGSGAISQASGKVVIGNSVAFNSTSGNVGSSGSGAVNTQTSSLTVNTSGNAYISNTNAVLNLGAS
ncbi:hypothetical protein ACP3WC_24210, partial [Salmonella enterica]|uniref:hypothetical protein n=1 Tax=Salmonella enterica TaxID=28901 RepID=UPI003CEB3762